MLYLFLGTKFPCKNTCINGFYLCLICTICQWLDTCNVILSKCSIATVSGFLKSEIPVGFEDVCLKCAAISSSSSWNKRMEGLLFRMMSIYSLHLELLPCFSSVSVFTFLIHMLCLATKSSLRPCWLVECSDYWVHYGPRWERMDWQAESIEKNNNKKK